MPLRCFTCGESHMPSHFFPLLGQGLPFLSVACTHDFFHLISTHMMKNGKWSVGYQHMHRKACTGLAALVVLESCNVLLLCGLQWLCILSGNFMCTCSLGYMNAEKWWTFFFTAFRYTPWGPFTTHTGYNTQVFQGINLHMWDTFFHFVSDWDLLV